MKVLVMGCLTISFNQIWAGVAWQECETIDIDQFNPRIIWNSSMPDPELSEVYNEVVGTIEVISDYRDPHQSKRFSLDLVKYERRRGKRVKNYFISLPGGPGGSRDEVRRFLAPFQSLDEIAYFGVSYRGFMQFARAQETSEPQPDLEHVISQGPFAPKDLTMENAARDVVMVIRAIQLSPTWQEGDRIFLEGFSAGSREAHLIIAQYPDLVDVAFLGGIPPFGQLAHGNYDGIIEHCLLDELCRTRMGSNLKVTFVKHIWDISNADFNECTRMFHATLDTHELPKDLNKPLRPGKRLMRVLASFYKIYSTTMAKGVPHTWAQLALVVIRAMHDCKNPATFEQEILPLIQVCLRERGRKEGKRAVASVTKINKDLSVDLFLNEVFSSTSDYNPVVKRDLLRIKDEESETLALNQIFFRPIKEKFREMKKYIKNARYFEEEPIVTNKTQVYIFASRMDVNTPPNTAKDLYDKIQSPKKFWILYDDLVHESGYRSSEHLTILALAILDTSSPSKIVPYVKRANAVRRHGWSFQGYHLLEKLWNHVEPSSNALSPELKNDDFLPMFMYSPNLDNVGRPSPLPKARCIIISQHPTYKERFGLGEKQDEENTMESSKATDPESEEKVDPVIADQVVDKDSTDHKSDFHQSDHEASQEEGKTSVEQADSGAEIEASKEEQQQPAMEAENVDPNIVNAEAIQEEEQPGTDVEEMDSAAEPEASQGEEQPRVVAGRIDSDIEPAVGQGAVERKTREVDHNINRDGDDVEKVREAREPTRIREHYIESTSGSVNMDSSRMPKRIETNTLRKKRIRPGEENVRDSVEPSNVGLSEGQTSSQQSPVLVENKVDSSTSSFNLRPIESPYSTSLKINGTLQKGMESMTIQKPSVNQKQRKSPFQRSVPSERATRPLRCGSTRLASPGTNTLEKLQGPILSRNEISTATTLSDNTLSSEKDSDSSAHANNLSFIYLISCFVLYLSLTF